MLVTARRWSTSRSSSRGRSARAAQADHRDRPLHPGAELTEQRVVALPKHACPPGRASCHRPIRNTAPVLTRPCRLSAGRASTANVSACGYGGREGDLATPVRASMTDAGAAVTDRSAPTAPGGRPPAAGRRRLGAGHRGPGRLARRARRQLPGGIRSARRRDAPRRRWGRRRLAPPPARYRRQRTGCGGRHARGGPERGLPWWAALLAADRDRRRRRRSSTRSARARSRGGFNIGIVVASVVAILLVRRSHMFPVVIAPPIVYSARGGLPALPALGRAARQARSCFDAAANYLVYGFPAIAAATAAVLIIAGIRLITRRS